MGVGCRWLGSLLLATPQNSQKVFLCPCAPQAYELQIYSLRLGGFNKLRGQASISAPTDPSLHSCILVPKFPMPLDPTPPPVLF